MRKSLNYILIKQCVTIISVVIWGIPLLYGQEGNPNRVLDSLKTELNKIENKLEAGRGFERDVLGQIDQRQKQVALQEELIRSQAELRKAYQDSISVLEKYLLDKESELSIYGVRISDIDARRSELSKALVKSLLAGNRISKFGTLDFLMGARSWRDLFARRNLIQKLQDTEKNYLSSLSESVDTLQNAESLVSSEAQMIKSQKDLLILRKGESFSLEQDMRLQSEKLTSQKQNLSRQLTGIKGNQKLLEARRSEIAEAQSAITKMIEKMMRGESLAGISLGQLRGLLPWPVKGRVVEKFGLVKNNRLSTVTENPGIELVTSSDEPVKSVAEGKVSTVTWLRGFGNVCIVEHAGSFFTVYAGLGQINVKANDAVSSGTVLGFASFDPSSDEYRVHFELWSGKEKKDPLDWLSR